MQGLDLFLIFTSPLEAAGLDYFVTGSVASMVYGELRMTHDIDLVLAVSKRDAEAIEAAFPPESFYCPPEEVIRLEIGRRHRGHFNLIHHDSGYKADVYLQGSDPLHAWAMERRQSFELGAGRLWVAPPEYVILRKLEYYREGGSEKHLSDIRGMFELSADAIDEEELHRWIARLGLAEQWAEVG